VTTLVSAIASPLLHAVHEGVQHAAVDLEDQVQTFVRDWWLRAYGREPESPEAVELQRGITHLVRNVLQSVTTGVLMASLGPDVPDLRRVANGD
jgi:hypothetical protein